MEKYKEYYNTGATEAVWILKVLYFMCIPFAKLFIKFKVRPHTITSLSNISALLSYVFLFFNLYLFIFFWFLALVFDVCDGIVARMTKQSSAAGSFYDHYSDIVKILLLYFFVALKYDTTHIWILAMSNIVVFSLMVIANMILSQREAILRYEINKIGQKENISVPIRKKGYIKRFVNKYKFVKKTLLFLYSSIFVIYGNFNLLLIPLGINIDWAFYTFIIVFIIVFKSLLSIIKTVHQKNTFMQEENIRWK